MHVLNNAEDLLGSHCLCRQLGGFCFLLSPLCFINVLEQEFSLTIFVEQFPQQGLHLVNAFNYYCNTESI